MAILALVFWSMELKAPFWQKFYQYVPALLLCYFLPSLLNITWLKGSAGAFRLVDGENSPLYEVASRYLLPASLILLTLNIDFPALRRLGPKALVMFLTGTLGIILGGPIAFLIVAWLSPETVAGEVWRGLTTIAGSWIGGGANQAAMKEVFAVNEAVFSAMIAIDVITANIWMAVLLYGAGISQSIDQWLKADNQAVEEVKQKVAAFEARTARIPQLSDWMQIAGLAFGGVALAHALADMIAPYLATQAPYLEAFSLTSGFFWIVVLATTFGLLLSLSPARQLEGAGASKMGSLLLYILIATIGLKMDISAILDKPMLFVLGLIWMLVHAVLLLGVAWLIKAPFFFVAVGSQANVGGAASAPIVASAFHPALAPVGVLLAVLGYALGTYGAWLCGILLRILAV
ncbi:MAG: DUF819 family protein [Microscillaceae bacterium]|nr:DUF819 family protein [Microscillaceae bacterium]